LYGNKMQINMNKLNKSSAKLTRGDSNLLPACDVAVFEKFESMRNSRFGF